MATLCRDCADTTCPHFDSVHLGGLKCFKKKTDTTELRHIGSELSELLERSRSLLSWINEKATKADSLSKSVAISEKDRLFNLGRAVAFAEDYTQLKEIIDTF